MKRIFTALMSTLVVLSLLLALASCSTQTGNEERFHRGQRPSSDSSSDSTGADSSNSADISNAGADLGTYIECSCAILDVKIADADITTAPDSAKGKIMIAVD